MNAVCNFGKRVRRKTNNVRIKDEVILVIKDDKNERGLLVSYGLVVFYWHFSLPDGDLVERRNLRLIEVSISDEGLLEVLSYADFIILETKNCIIWDNSDYV